MGCARESGINDFQLESTSQRVSRTSTVLTPTAKLSGHHSLSIDKRATSMIRKLESGDILPEIRLQLVGGGTLSLPSDLDTDFGVVLFYRGYW